MRFSGNCVAAGGVGDFQPLARKGLLSDILAFASADFDAWHWGGLLGGMSHRVAFNSCRIADSIASNWGRLVDGFGLFLSIWRRGSVPLFGMVDNGAFVRGDFPTAITNWLDLVLPDLSFCWLAEFLANGGQVPCFYWLWPSATLLAQAGLYTLAAVVVCRIKDPATHWGDA